DVAVGDGGRADWSGAGWTLVMHGLRTFDDAPAEIRAAFDMVDHLPHLPADIAGPERAVGRIERHLPGVANTIGPDFAAGIGLADEGVVRRNAISPWGR